MRRSTIEAALFSLLLLHLTSGCFAPKGIIYTRIREPLALPAERIGAPVADKECYVSLTRLKEPVTRINLSVMWSNNIVKEEVAKAGMTEIYYSDIETLSVLSDSYVRKRIIFYGR